MQCSTFKQLQHCLLVVLLLCNFNNYSSVKLGQTGVSSNFEFFNNIFGPSHSDCLIIHSTIEELLVRLNKSKY